MATVVERVEGHYVVQDVEFGRVYRWCPDCVVVECDCGERVVLNSSMTTCWCGADHTAVVREKLSARRMGEASRHPWRYAEEREGAGLPF